ncbi:MAG TPA: hypothetical protein VFR87_20935 [Nocardioidaceae bacterium]|nr:hypothetical protein [Nocardioidaceae bacterium]
MTRDAGADRTRGIQMMILGAVVAVLAPLGGFLGGSMVGPAREMGDFDAMFVWMFAGLLVGGIGAVLVLLGLLRWSRATRHEPVSRPRTPPS